MQIRRSFAICIYSTVPYHINKIYSTALQYLQTIVVPIVYYQSRIQKTFTSSHNFCVMDMKAIKYVIPTVLCATAGYLLWKRKQPESDERLRLVSWSDAPISETQTSHCNKLRRNSYNEKCKKGATVTNVAKVTESRDKQMYTKFQEGETQSAVVVRLLDEVSSTLNDARSEILQFIQSTNINLNIDDSIVIAQQNMHITISNLWDWRPLQNIAARTHEHMFGNVKAMIALRQRDQKPHTSFLVVFDRIALLGGKTLLAFWTVLEDANIDYDPVYRLRVDIGNAVLGRRDFKDLLHPAGYNVKRNLREITVFKGPGQDGEHITDGFLHSTLFRLHPNVDIDVGHVHSLCNIISEKLRAQHLCMNVDKMLVTHYNGAGENGQGGHQDPLYKKSRISLYELPLGGEKSL